MKTSLNRAVVNQMDHEMILPERPCLTPLQATFLETYTTNPFQPLAQICRTARTNAAQVKKWKRQSPEFAKALEIEHTRSRVVANMSRKTVMRGILEAIDMAKDLRQPNGMISGYREIGRMCGFYEPERREVILSVDGKQMVEEIRSLSKERLLELAAEQDVIEASFELVEE